MEAFKIVKIKGSDKEVVEDFTAEEVPLTLAVNDKELATILCCPYDLEDLIRGFLFTCGLIKKPEDINKIVINKEQWTVFVDLTDNDRNIDLVFKRLYTSGCGRGTLFYNAADIINRVKITSCLKINAQRINALMADFQKKSEVYLKTGGVHSAALADKQGILIFREDIGRHNAIDKVIGRGLEEDMPFEDKIMISSGRISSEVLFKIQKCGIPIIISKSAATNQGIMLARDMGLTLVGFARGNRMNIYSAEGRIE